MRAHLTPGRLAMVIVTVAPAPAALPFFAPPSDTRATCATCACACVREWLRTMSCRLNAVRHVLRQAIRRWH